MDHQGLIQIIIAYTAVGVFVATSVLTILALFNIITIDKDIKTKLFTVLIVEVSVISVGVFAGFMTINPSKVVDKINNMERVNQTLQTAPDKAIETPLSILRPRVYIHIRKESQRNELKEIAKKLPELINVSVPGVQLVKLGPKNNEFRYFRESEKEMANNISEKISNLGVTLVTRYIRGFEESTRIRANHFELWISN